MRKSHLCLIPARMGSKGIPGKNLKPLNRVPLIEYTLKAAREIFNKKDICVSTDWPELKSYVENLGIAVPFLRPGELATDQSGSHEVMIHALDYYREKLNIEFDNLVLLQVTSPFRRAEDIQKAMELMDDDTNAVVSVKKTPANPYYSLFEQNSEGYLSISKPGDFTRRQDCPEVYELNGAIYIISTQALRKLPLGRMQHLKKYLMSEEHSLDLDTPFDWFVAECLMKYHSKEKTE